MVDKVFSVTGNKISALIIDENSLKFSSSTSDTVETFKEAFAKKLSLATKFKIKYKAIKSIRKEYNDKDILIKYKTFIGIPSVAEFSFNNPTDYDTFFTYFEKEQYFTRRHETLTPFRAIRNYLIGLLAAIGMTIFCYYQAIEIANGTVVEATSGRVRTFNYVVSLLGEKGVIGIGTLLSAYLLYKIWKRFSNPPNQINLLPPNSLEQRTANKALGKSAA